MTFYSKFFLICLVFMTAACAEIVVKQVDYATPVDIPDDAHPAPIKFSKIQFLLPPGTEIGLESGMGPTLLGGICSWSNYPVSRRALSRKFETKWLEAAFEDALESQGYDVTNSIDIDFDYEDELARAEYFISARVRDIDLDLCKRGRLTTFNIFNTAEGAKGKLYAKIDWSVYDALRRKTVYKTTTEGYSRRDYPNTEGLELLFMDAFEMAAHNLGTDQEFYDLIVEGQPPSKDNNLMFDKKPRETRRDFDPLEPVTIQNPPLNTQPFPLIAEDKRRTAVTIQKLGHGSGFFITKEGHLLTNAHVVGDSVRTRVILADKEKAYIAEVLRINKPRDVALLKLIDPPDTLDIPILPIRTQWPAVGEDVYAIGTPKHYSLMENTVTKGIVSNHRYDHKYRGLKMNYIQADVNIHGGNSGGPLLDEHGNIVGMTVLTYFANPGKRGIDLNFFIPIEEALGALDIDLAP